MRGSEIRVAFLALALILCGAQALAGPPGARDAAVDWLVAQGCTVNPMEGDVVAG